MEQISLPQSKEQKQQQQQMMSQRRQVLATFLTPDALTRLDRVQLVSADKAAKVEAVIYQLAQTKQVQPQGIDEGRLKQMLEGLSGHQAGGLILGGAAECDGSGNLVMQRRVDLLDGVKELGDDDLSF